MEVCKEWIGQRPPILDRLYLRLKLKTSYLAGKVLDLEMLHRLGVEAKARLNLGENDKSLYFFNVVKQKVGPALQDELNLLAKGAGWFLSREMMIIYAYNDRNELYKSEVISGSRSSVSTQFQIKKLIDKLVSQISNEGGILKSIEIVHTHPSKDLLLYKSDRLVYLINGLGKADIDMASIVARLFKSQVIVKAISGSKISYSYELN